MNEQEYLQSLSNSTPDEIVAAVLHADERQARVLQIYLGSDQLGRIQRLASNSVARGAAAPKRGNVVVLHGIMGGQLSEFATASPALIWVQILGLIAGHFDKLALDADGNSPRDIRPSGIYLRYYGSLLVSLNQDWNVRPFFFDWRRDLRFAADDLNQMLATQFPNQPVHLVAHSMGGLVARSFIARHPDRWNVADPSGARGNLVMLGTPNYGSFAVPRLLLGTNEVLALLAKIDLHHDNRQILEIAKTFTGAYQMLPAKGHIDGLDVLYNAATYTVSPIPQSLLDGALTFQSDIAKSIDPDRMVYVAGYNRVTPAAIKDITRLANDDGYVLSRRGDGTVPHDLGLLAGVRTFFIDEEHLKLPANTRVQAAMTELLETCDQANENNLWKALGPEFDNQRGADAGSQQLLLVSNVARRALKEQQVAAIRNAVLSRGDLQPETVAPEEQALADLLLQHDALRLSVAEQSLGADVPGVASIKTDTSAPSTVNIIAPLSTEIRIHVLQKSIAEVGPNDTGDQMPIDCIAVGHYFRVRPTGAERDLDVAISSALRPDVNLQEPS